MAITYYYVFIFKNMELTYFDKIVHYQICDFLYDEFIKSQKGKVYYQTFTSMCNVLSKKIKSGVFLSKSERAIVARVMERLKLFFGFDDKESVEYTYEFLVDEIWGKYHSSVNAINSVFYQSKNI